MPRNGEQVLSVMFIRVLQSSDRRVSLTEIAQGFDVLHVPKPKNLSAEISRLIEKKFVIRAGDGQLGITPLGEREARQLVGSAQSPEIERISRRQSGVPVGSAYQSVVAPALAPSQYVNPIQSFLSQYQFEYNVFCMTRFPQSAADTTYLDPVENALREIRTALSEHSLTMHLASDQQMVDTLSGNVLCHMWASQYGVGLLEDRAGRGLNYNVVAEIAGMLMTGRRCVLLKDPSVGSLPSDIAGHIYKEVDLSDGASVAKAIHEWVNRDLLLGSCKVCEA